jgi:hypothetical protein
MRACKSEIAPHRRIAGLLDQRRIALGSVTRITAQQA